MRVVRERVWGLMVWGYLLQSGGVGAMACVLDIRHELTVRHGRVAGIQVARVSALSRINSAHVNFGKSRERLSFHRAQFPPALVFDSG